MSFLNGKIWKNKRKNKSAEVQSLIFGDKMGKPESFSDKRKPASAQTVLLYGLFDLFWGKIAFKEVFSRSLPRVLGDRRGFA